MQLNLFKIKSKHNHYLIFKNSRIESQLEQISFKMMDQKDSDNQHLTKERHQFENLCSYQILRQHKIKVLIFLFKFYNYLLCE